ncbi:S-layer homology domain-containing protein [Bacillus sp. FJAT-26390]|uniref:S-layer homology domain-containing protein n=1 Tax=Bacillus sp. FJAT-26390 TaxID=1743142 RepID=UPI000807AB07|nr:S-layer homology domain-containing protein [Bacillus sp. FJAT-26390]OBZ12674.1 hypothetical protein A7975_16910 [Bacillus sp. FJAT-26390]
MNKKWLALIIIAAILWGNLAGVNSVQAATAQVTVDSIASVKPGQEIVISGTALYPEVVVKVIDNAKNVVEFIDTVQVTNGTYSVKFKLSSDASAGKHHVVVGIGSNVANQNFDVTIVSTPPGGPGGPGPVPGPIVVVPTPTTSSPNQINAPADVVKIEQVTVDGKTVVKAQLDKKKLSDFINKDVAASPVEKQTVVVDVAGNGQQVEVSLTLGMFQSLKDKASNASIQFNTQVGQISFPVQTLTEKAAELNLKSDFTIKIIISTPDEKTTQGINDIFAKSGAQSLAAPVDFIIVADLEGKDVELNQFSSYTEHILTIPQASGDDFSHYSGVYFDPSTNQFYPLPTLFTTNSNGEVLSSILRKGNSLYSVVKNVKTFSDVLGTYAQKPVETLASKFFISGFPDGKFRPNQKVTRAEFTAMISRALGALPETAGNQTFKDVPKSSWYAGVVSTAVKAGLVSGYKDNTFRPDQQITRQEMVVMMYNAMKHAGYVNSMAASDKDQLLNSFVDRSSIAAWAKDATAIAIQEKIVNGLEGNAFAPLKSADRAQSATIVYRMMQTLKFIN